MPPGSFDWYIFLTFFSSLGVLGYVLLSMTVVCYLWAVYELLRHSFIYLFYGFLDHGNVCLGWLFLNRSRLKFIMSRLQYIMLPAGGVVLWELGWVRSEFMHRELLMCHCHTLMGFKLTSMVYGSVQLLQQASQRLALHGTSRFPPFPQPQTPVSRYLWDFTLQEGGCLDYMANWWYDMQQKSDAVPWIPLDGVQTCWLDILPYIVWGICNT